MNKKGMQEIYLTAVETLKMRIELYLECGNKEVREKIRRLGLKDINVWKVWCDEAKLFELSINTVEALWRRTFNGFINNSKTASFTNYYKRI